MNILKSVQKFLVFFLKEQPALQIKQTDMFWNNLTLSDEWNY